MHRPSLGWAALLLLVAGVSLLALPAGEDPYLGAVFVRAGLVLGALWLALPNIRRAPRWLLGAAAVLAAVVVIRPRLILYAFPVAAVVALLGAAGRLGNRS